jgi:hypothetical protein
MIFDASVPAAALCAPTVFTDLAASPIDGSYPFRTCPSFAP